MKSGNLSKRKKKKKVKVISVGSSTYSNFRDEAFLAFVDSRMKKKPLRWFDLAACGLNMITLQKKAVANFFVDGRIVKVASKSVSIFKALIYKMSAPYRHMMFWRACRRVFKDLLKINDSEAITSLSRISAGATDPTHFLSDFSINFLAAFLISRAISLCRLRPLCVGAASHCIEQLKLRHFTTSNLLLIGLLADVYNEIRKHIRVAVEGYDLVVPLLSDERYPKSLANFEEIKKAQLVSSFGTGHGGIAFGTVSEILQFSEDHLFSLLSTQRSFGSMDSAWASQSCNFIDLGVTTEIEDKRISLNKHLRAKEAQT